MTERHHDSDKAQQQGKLYFYYIFYKLPGAPFFRPSFLDFIGDENGFLLLRSKLKKMYNNGMIVCLLKVHRLNFYVRTRQIDNDHRDRML